MWPWTATKDNNNNNFARIAPELFTSYSMSLAPYSIGYVYYTKLNDMYIIASKHTQINDFGVWHLLCFFSNKS